MASPSEPINLQQTASMITKHWTPQHILTLNQSHSLKLATIKGDFIWHSHPETDELFYCVSGGPFHMDIATSELKSEKDGWRTVELKVGDVFNVPRGVRHRPRADVETGILMVEKVGTVNTGDEEDSERTVYFDEKV